MQFTTISGMNTPRLLSSAGKNAEAATSKAQITAVNFAGIPKLNENLFRARIPPSIKKVTLCPNLYHILYGSRKKHAASATAVTHTGNLSIAFLKSGAKALSKNKSRTNHKGT